MNTFSYKIISWYKKSKRDLPWRNTQDPYKIWLSEIILQQTRVEQGMPYYFAFTEKYPTVKHLAKAPIDDVMKTWQGLGYYSRAGNIYATAKIVANDHKGVFPKTYDEIIKLKGIGPYTAAAISSFCFNEVQAVVDGNVYRVLARYFGIGTAIDSTKGKKEFQLLAEEVLNKKQAGLHNQAIMEFGALQCKPQNPDCINCPLSASCVALAEGRVDVLPLKEKKTKVRNRYFYYFIIEDKTENTLIHKRVGKDIWTGLYEFPMMEEAKKISEKELLKKASVFLSNDKLHIKKISSEKKHVLSHQHIHATFVHVDWKGSLKKKEHYQIIQLSSIHKYALPRLIDRYLRG